MEIKIKSMKYEDFRDNEYLETYAKLQQEGVPVAIGCALSTSSSEVSPRS